MSRSTRRDEMRRLLRRKERAGLSYRALAEETGISRNTLASWASRLRREEGPSFVEVVVEDDGPRAEEPVEITLAGGVVRVSRGFDEGTLRRVLALLSERC